MTFEVMQMGVDVDLMQYVIRSVGTTILMNFDAAEELRFEVSFRL